MTRQPGSISRVIAGLMLVEAVTLAIASIVHFGVVIPLGVVTLDDPFAGARIPEAIIAVVVGVAAISLLIRDCRRPRGCQHCSLWRGFPPRRPRLSFQPSGRAPGDGRPAVDPGGAKSHSELAVIAGHQRRVIENPISGERIVVRQTAAETGGQLFVFDLFLPPGAHVPARHAHPIQEEQFTVLAGRMRFRLGRRIIEAGPGETVVVPVGKAHWFGNAGVEVSQARVEVRPALRTEEFFEANETMARAGHFLGTRLPRLSDLARVLLEFEREVSVPNVPPFLVKGFLAPLAWLARRRVGGRG